MRTTALVNVFNEEALIKRTLSRLCPWLDKVLVFDGAYQDFPHRKPFSTDKTLEIARSFENVEVFECKKPFRDQIHKRSFMLDKCQEGDFFLICDADEWINRPDLLQEIDYDSFDVGWVWVSSPLYPRPYRTPRLFRFMPGMHYAGRHYWIYDRDKHLVCSHQVMTDRYINVNVPITLFNELHKHSSSRSKKKRIFRQTRNRQELSFHNEAEVYGKDLELIPHPDRAPAKTGGREVKIIKRPSRPKYSMIVPFTRSWAVGKWMEHFQKVEMPWRETEILAVADSSSKELFQAVSDWFSDRFAERANGIQVLFTGRNKPPERSKSSIRRRNIASNWEWFLTMAQGDFLLCAEDDTLPDYDAYPRLIDIQKDTGASFVQGTEVGRWAVPVIPHWTMRWSEKGVVERVFSSSFTGENIVRIHGGGWYCAIIRTDHAREVGVRLDENEIPAGPDLTFVHDLCGRGYECLGVWDIECDHFGENFSLHPAETKIKLLCYEKTPSGGWRVQTSPGKGRGKPRKNVQPSKIQVGKNGKGSNGMVTLIAKKNFQGTDARMIFRGEKFETSATRARQLISRGLAVEVSEVAPPQKTEVVVKPVEMKPKKAAAKATAPKIQPAKQPAEVAVKAPTRVAEPPPMVTPEADIVLREVKEEKIEPTRVEDELEAAVVEVAEIEPEPEPEEEIVERFDDRGRPVFSQKDAEDLESAGRLPNNARVECPRCDRNYKGLRGLEMHLRSSH